MVALKRYHHQFLPDVLSFETGALTDDEVAKLESLGHEMSEARRAYGNMNVVLWDYDGNRVEAVADPRARVEGRVY